MKILGRPCPTQTKGKYLPLRRRTRTTHTRTRTAHYTHPYDRITSHPNPPTEAGQTTQGTKASGDTYITTNQPKNGTEDARLKRQKIGVWLISHPRHSTPRAPPLTHRPHRPGQPCCVAPRPRTPRVRPRPRRARQDGRQGDARDGSKAAKGSRGASTPTHPHTHTPHERSSHVFFFEDRESCDANGPGCRTTQETPAEQGKEKERHCKTSMGRGHARQEFATRVTICFHTALTRPHRNSPDVAKSL